MFDQDDDWDSPYEPRGQRKQQFQRARYAQASHKTSVLSIISMISGLSALPGICMCFISVPLGLMAIASGHGARSVIRHGDGEYGGSEMATIGLITGYLALLITGGIVALLTLFTTGPGPRPAPAAVKPAETTGPETLSGHEAGTRRLRQTLVDLNNSVEGIAGLSSTDTDAVDLARHIQESLTELQVIKDTQNSGPGSAPTRIYRVYAKVDSNCITVLIHVGRLREPDLPNSPAVQPIDRREVEDDCWVITQRSAQDLAPIETRVVVGIYADSQLKSVLSGKISDSPEVMAGLESRSQNAIVLAREFVHQK